MKMQNKHQKIKLIFFIFILFFILLNITVINFQYNGFSFAEENYNCRLLDITLFGTRVLKCYIAEEPPYWGCLGCPWVEYI